MEPFKILILGVLGAIVISLGTGLFHLVKGQGSSEEGAAADGRPDRGAAAEHSRKMARALTIRVALSITLFLLIMIGWYTGLIAPHGAAR